MFTLAKDDLGKGQDEEEKTAWYDPEEGWNPWDHERDGGEGVTQSLFGSLLRSRFVTTFFSFFLFFLFFFPTLVTQGEFRCEDVNLI